jgi:hypothetical protein
MTFFLYESVFHNLYSLYRPSEHKNFKQLIHTTYDMDFIEPQLYYYIFRLVEPSSGNTC